MRRQIKKLALLAVFGLAFGEIGNFSWGKSVVYKPEIEKDPVCERCSK